MGFSSITRFSLLCFHSNEFFWLLIIGIAGGDRGHRWNGFNSLFFFLFLSAFSFRSLFGRVFHQPIECTRMRTIFCCCFVLIVVLCRSCVCSSSFKFSIVHHRRRRVGTHTHTHHTLVCYKNYSPKHNMVDVFCSSFERCTGTTQHMHGPDMLTITMKCYYRFNATLDDWALSKRCANAFNYVECFTILFQLFIIWNSIWSMGDGRWAMADGWCKIGREWNSFGPFSHCARIRTLFRSFASHIFPQRHMHRFVFRHLVQVFKFEPHNHKTYLCDHTNWRMLGARARDIGEISKLRHMKFSFVSNMNANGNYYLCVNYWCVDIMWRKSPSHTILLSFTLPPLSLSICSSLCLSVARTKAKCE